MRILPTRIHGLIDYLVGILFIALPKFSGWNHTANYLLSILGVSVIVYSLITDYELGAYKLMPMPVHLLLDLLIGIILIIAPLFMTGAGSGIQAWLIILGAFSIVIAFITEMAPGAAANAKRQVGV